jgi:hypothetical protein
LQSAQNSKLGSKIKPVSEQISCYARAVVKYDTLGT